MAYLQLAEENDYYSQLAENPKENYIFIPAGYKGAAKDMHVREDYFDGMPEAEYMQMIQELAPYQSVGLSAVGAALATAGGIAKKLIDKRKARVAAGTAKPLFKPGGLISKIGAKLKGANQNQPSEEVAIFERNAPISGSVNVGGANIDFGTEPQKTFFQKYKTPLIIGGVVLLAGGVYLATRKKK